MGKNGKRIVLMVAFLVILVVISIKYINVNQRKENENINGSIAIYIDDGSGYKLSTSKEFPKEGFKLNMIKSVCNNGSTISQNDDRSISLSLNNSDSCNLYFDKSYSSLEVLKFLNLTVSDGTPDFSKISPQLTNQYIDDEFSTDNYYKYDVNSDNYFVYADSYSFNESSSLYSLINPKIDKYSNIYSSLPGKYIVYYQGQTNNELPNYTNLGRIYKVMEVTDSQITVHWSSSRHNHNGEANIYSAEDDYGTSYYFRGAVENNYVKFGKWQDNLYKGYKDSSSSVSRNNYFSLEECQNSANFNYNCSIDKQYKNKDIYWRIIRINGDGSLRLIYDGTEPHENGVNSSDRFIGTSIAFNASKLNNAYVGYMYGNINGSTYGEVHNNINDSTIKKYLDNWYRVNFANTIYTEYISDEIFCNDRSLYSGTGLGSTYNEFGAYNRLDLNKDPKLTCTQKNDAFTVSDTKKGNGSLTYPVGLLTADEAVVAGNISNNNNTNSYLYKGSTYLTMTPSYFEEGDVPYLYGIDQGYTTSTDTGGQLYLFDGTVPYNVAPVINLSAKIAKQLIGTGIISDPFRLEI